MRKIAILVMVTLTVGFLLTPLPSDADPNMHIIISKKTNQLALMQSDKTIKVFPVATGKLPSYTPEGTFTIVTKLVNPYYGKGRIPGGSPRNPLGPRWLGLSKGGGGVYGIHGNNNPASIGTYASAGCIRMYNNDVIWLFDQVPRGTPVTITGAALYSVQKTVTRESIMVEVNGNTLSLPAGTNPFRSNGELFLPLRRCVEALGYNLYWNNREQSIDIHTPLGPIKLRPNSKKIILGEKKLQLNNPPLHIDGTVYIPLNFFEKALNYCTFFDTSLKKATIKKLQLTINKP